MLALIGRYTPAAVSVLLLYSGIYKLFLPAGAVMALEALEVNHRLAVAVIVGVTGLEIYLAILLLLKRDLKYGLALTTGLILAFTLFLAYLSTLAHPPSCGCMGLTAVFNSNRANALLGLARNCVLLWLLQGAREYYFPASATSATPAEKPAGMAPDVARF